MKQVKLERPYADMGIFDAPECVDLAEAKAFTIEGITLVEGVDYSLTESGSLDLYVIDGDPVVIAEFEDEEEAE